MRFDEKQCWILFLVVLCVALARGPLFGSLWLDETLTAWLTTDGFSETWKRAVMFQGQSPFYFELVWLSRLLIADLECSLRLPGVLCGCATLAVTARIAMLLAPRTAAAPLSCTVLLVTDGFQRALFSARPYSLALFCALTSLYTVLLLRERVTPMRLGLYGLSLIGTWYAHYLFILSFILHIPSLFCCVLPRWQVALTSMIAGIFMLPGLIQLQSLSTRSDTLAFAPPVSLLSLVQGIVPLPLLVILLAAGLIGALWGARFTTTQLTREEQWLLGLWIVFPASFFAAATLAKETSLFVPRYWSWQLPGLALLVGVVFGTCTYGLGRSLAVGILFAGTLFRLTTQTWVAEGWREVSQEIQKHAGLPVVLASGLIESEDAMALSNTESAGYLHAPLRVYGVTNPIYVVGATNFERCMQQSELTDFLVATLSFTRQGVVMPRALLEKLGGMSLDSREILSVGVTSLYRVTTRDMAGVVKPNAQ